MPTPALSREDCEAALAAVNEAIAQGHAPPGTVAKNGKSSAIDRAAETLGLHKMTLHTRVRIARERFQMVPGAEMKPGPGKLSFPVFPDDDIPAEQILDHMARRFTQAKAASDARKWFRIAVKENLPIGINWFGDPHLGNPGCNVPLLRKDIETVKRTPGMYGANIGDTVDNWGGRLVRLYAETDVSRKTERALARWFLKEAGVPWLLWLHGNHDTMSGEFSLYMDTIGSKVVPMIDWRAQFVVAFSNGAEFKIDAAHNHKGHSMWNPLHGQQRASVMEEDADLYIAGHHHTWASMTKEAPGGRVVTLARVRGYKFMDHFAVHHQFLEQDQGSSGVSILDPTTDRPTERLRYFSDTTTGAEYLTYLRAKAKRK